MVRKFHFNLPRRVRFVTQIMKNIAVLVFRMHTGLDWAAGTPGDSRWAGGSTTAKNKNLISLKRMIKLSFNCKFECSNYKT